MQSFKVGDRVLFGRAHGERTLGEVVKINRSRMRVKQLDARGTYKTHPIGTVWVVPMALCDHADGRTAPTEAALPARTEDAIMEDILRTYVHLSPENLSCDGELSRAECYRRGIALNARLRGFFKEIGRTVSEDEAYRYCDHKRVGRVAS
jgi:hypothetical protein